MKSKLSLVAERRRFFEGLSEASRRLLNSATIRLFLGRHGFTEGLQ